MGYGASDCIWIINYTSPTQDNKMKRLDEYSHSIEVQPASFKRLHVLAIPLAVFFPEQRPRKVPIVSTRDRIGLDRAI